jgi:hypothetical protein
VGLQFCRSGLVYYPQSSTYNLPKFTVYNFTLWNGSVWSAFLKASVLFRKHWRWLTKSKRVRKWNYITKNIINLDRQLQRINFVLSCTAKRYNNLQYCNLYYFTFRQTGLLHYMHIIMYKRILHCSQESLLPHQILLHLIFIYIFHPSQYYPNL